MYYIAYTKRALKDIKLLKRNCLEQRAKELIGILERDPFEVPPPYEKLKRDLAGAYSRRINYQHRLVYEVVNGCIDVAGVSYEGYINILRMWTHYDI